MGGVSPENKGVCGPEEGDNAWQILQKLDDVESLHLLTSKQQNDSIVALSSVE